MPGLVKDQIKLFQASKFTQIVVTDVNKVYRWRTEIDKAYTECSFEKTEESRMGMLGGLGKNLLFSDKSKKVDVVDRIFQDFQGYHCLLTNRSGDWYYLNYNSVKIKKLNNLREVMSAVSFSQLCVSESTGYFVLGTDDGEIIFWKIDFNQNGEVVEGTPIRQVIKLP